MVPLGAQVQIGPVRFGSAARRAGVEQGWEVVALKLPAERPSPHWFYLPALALVALVWFAQGLRMRRVQPLARAA